VFIAGFPPAMLLAWTLDISTQGIKRTPESGYSKTRGAMAKFGMALVATAMSAGVLWWMWDDYILQSGERVTRSGIKEQPVIAVQAPRQLAGKTDNEWLGDGIANLVRSELAESQHAVVISQTRWSALTAAAADDEETSQIARSIGVDYLIDGELFETPRGIVLTMHVEDVDTGIQLVSPRASGETAADIIGSIPTLGIEIKQALRIPHQERVGLFEADFAIDNIEAYETYVAGLAYLIDFEYQDAERAFNTVLSIAPDYHIARFRLAQLYETTGRAELARSTLDAIPDDTNLSRRLQLYIDGAKAYFIAEQDPQKAIEIYSELVELYPYEMEQMLAELD
jgi:TolB-like protein